MSAYHVFYDAQCPICIREMALVREQNVSGSLNTVPIQGNKALLAQYGVDADAAMTLLHVVSASGTISVAITNSDDRELIAFRADNKTVTSLLIKGN